ncbi:eukaryotic translation initiation factor 3 subunit D [Coccidioides immitis H538.4]|uniref:Eukaryotic translation initiation factor 3 subunit D n=1 Tax=Coccidioides immitis H538.4 TaxID=396776 RepID=A0A0J8RXZ7_COCIT|nr:eukaryotic translation initiation factor 3 subunit D [Coccidioides immitis H538.4]
MNNLCSLAQPRTLKALNEFDHKAQGAGGALDWRSKLYSQRGAVVATEMKNNNVKLARWTTQAILAKSDVMKLGFVTRANPRSATAHMILGVIGYKPREFALQMNLNMANGWGIVRTIIDLVNSLDARDEEEGDDAQEDKIKKYILVKDPNKSVVRLYSVPANTFEEEDDTGAKAEKDEESEEKDEE